MSIWGAWKVISGIILVTVALFIVYKTYGFMTALAIYFLMYGYNMLSEKN